MSNLLDRIFGRGGSKEVLALKRENERLKRELARLNGGAMGGTGHNGLESTVGRVTYKIIRDLFDKMGDASLLLSADGEMLYANEKFLEQHKMLREEIRGKVYDALPILTTKNRYEARVDEARRSGGTVTYERTLHRRGDKDDKKIQVSLFIYNLLGQETVWFFSKDVTELEKSRTDFRELNMLLNTILDNLPVYLFVKDVDNDFRYLYWNKAFADYSKIPASKVIGNTDFEVFPDYNDAQKFRDDDLEVINCGQPINRHETYMAADGSSRIVQTLKTIVPREGRGPLLIGVSMDVTSMSNIEQELIQERIKAEEADRLKSRFLANMSHEIRTPLNAIVGFSGLMVDEEDAELRRQFSDIIEQNNEVLLQLINDILDLSKIEAGTLEYLPAPMDLLDTFQNIYEMQKTRMPNGVVLRLDAPDTPFFITEDRTRISQVVNNLINNAVKFTKQGEIRYGYREEGDWVKVFVSDTGIGIAPDKLDSVFDRFVKLDQFAQGTGLGLSICKLIVETLGGEIHVESEVGRGTTFSFTIPYIEDKKYNQTTSLPTTGAVEALAIAATAAAKSDIAERALQTSGADEDAGLLPGEKAASDKGTILVAEDEPSNFLYVKALVKGRYPLLWAKDGSEAVRMFKEHRPDLIFMDIRMPGMDGLVATQLIRSYSANVPIYALSANAYDSDRRMALDAGMDGYLSKPIDRPRFEAVLKKHLEK